MAHFTTPEGKHYEAERATVRELLEQWHLKKAIGMTVGGGGRRLRQGFHGGHGVCAALP